MNERIKEIRKSINLSQADFGKRIGVSRDTIANIEGGRIELKDVFLKSICLEFKVNESWLRTGIGDMFEDVGTENHLMMWAADVLKDEGDSFKRRFVHMLSNLTDDEWDLLERKARELFDDQYNEKSQD